MKLFVKNIAILAGADSHGKLRLQGREMAETGIINDAFLYVEDGIIKRFGQMAEAQDLEHTPNVTIVDAEGGTVLPHGATRIRM